MRTPTLNRQRIDLRLTRPGQDQRVDRKLRELAEAGWVELAEGGRFHALTEAGEQALRAVQP